MNGQGHFRVILKGQIVAAAGSVIVPGVGSATHAAGQAVGSILHNDGFGSCVQNVPAGDLALTDYYGAARNEAGYRHRAVLPCGVAAQHSAVTVLHCKFSSRNGLSAHRIQLGQGQAAKRLIEEGEGLCIVRVDGDGLRLRGLVDHIAGSRLDLFRYNRACHAGDADFPVGIGGIEAVGGQMPVVVVHIAAGGIRQLKLSAGDESAGHAVLFLDNKRTGPLVPKGQLLHTPALDKNILGSSIQHEALHGLDLSGNHGGAGFDAVQYNFSRVVCIINAIIRPHSGPAAVHYFERYAGQRLIFRPLNELSDNKSGSRLIVKNQAVGNAGFHHNAFGRLVQNIAGRGLGFRHHNRAAGFQARDDHGSVCPGFVNAIGGTDRVTFTVPDDKLSVRQGLACHGIPLGNGQGGLGGVGDDDRLRVPVGPDHHIRAGGIHNIPCRGLGFGQHISTGGQIGNTDFSAAVGSKQTILGQGGRADHAVQTDLTARRRGDAELRAGEGLAGDAVPLLDNQGTAGLVLKGQGDGAARLDLDGLALRVDDESGRGAGFGDDHALARFQPGDTDFPVFIRSENAVGIPNQSTVRIHDLELRVL